MKSIFITLIVSMLVLLVAAYAESIQTEDGRVFVEATINSVTPSTVTIFHKDGISKVPLSAMPKQFRDKHGYDPIKAEEYKKTEEKNDNANAKILSEIIIKNTEEVRVKKILAEFDSHSKFVEIEIVQALENGVLGDAYCIEEYTEKVTTYSQGVAGPGLPTTRLVPRTRKTLVGENIFISGIINVADGERWSGKIWPAGTYSYSNIQNAKRTVRRWSSSREEAIILFQAQ